MSVRDVLLAGAQEDATLLVECARTLKGEGTFPCALVCQGNSIQDPVGQHLFGDSLPLLLSPITDRELLRVSKAMCAVQVNMLGTS